MNSLSWLIYLSGVVSGVKAVLVLAAIIMIAVCVVLLVAHMVDPGVRHSSITRKLIATVALCATAFALVAAIVPSQRTVLMIAASEMGEQVMLNSGADQLMQPSVQLLHNWIRREIERTVPTN